eukprot:TRINITY_DN10247_c0_g1_i8.p5 TRINITY_DN10247_c0_g1~~TRINITY_DN10247_c0_g1_i8.p5  ORF type:complete len:117 (-),score=1.72 TRINITY_DN10247_c0_g1_i8:928-1278(-)
MFVTCFFVFYESDNPSDLLNLSLPYSLLNSPPSLNLVALTWFSQKNQTEKKGKNFKGLNQNYHNNRLFSFLGRIRGGVQVEKHSNSCQSRRVMLFVFKKFWLKMTWFFLGFGFLLL